MDKSRDGVDSGFRKGHFEELREKSTHFWGGSVVHFIA